MESVLSFWFAHSPDMDKWFLKSADYDDHIRDHFSGLLCRAEQGHLDHWAATPRGWVALIVLLDQFSRHVYRGTKKAFHNDDAALRLARMDVHPVKDKYHRMFARMPFTHAEDRDAQVEGVLRAEEEAAGGDPFWRGVLGHALGHLRVIERFGRFPKRNRALGRATTPEEQAYIDETPGQY